MTGIYITLGFLCFYIVSDSFKWENQNKLKKVPDEMKQKLLNSQTRSEYIHACTEAQRDFLLSCIRKRNQR